MRNLFSNQFGRVLLASMPMLALAAFVTRPAAAQTFTVIYTFSGGADGATPLATPVLYNGSVYGTTSGGGTHAAGTVYALNFATRHQAVLHSFLGAPHDGSDPLAGLVQKPGGNFYGVTYKGGAYNHGAMFEISPNGAMTLLHSFAGPPTEGSGPAGTLVFDPAGDLFGTTYVGGSAKGWGTDFELSAGGVYNTGQSFSPDGALPRAGLYYQNGILYGTTCGGGAHQYGGTIFQVGVQSALYTFTGGADGSQPFGGLVGDGLGNLYGTTSAGGTGNFGIGNGVVFQFNPASGRETVLHTFTGPDGSSPAAGLARDAQGNLYGTTTLGGASGYGTVFKLDPSGNLTTLHNFTGGADGAKPYAGVIVDAQGNIWGAASVGGSAAAPAGYGTLFLITPAVN